MSEISLEDCDSWSCLSSVTSVGPITTHVFVVENFDEVMKESEFQTTVSSSMFEIEDTKWRIYLYPGGWDEKSKEHVGIFIHNVNSKNYVVNCKFTCCGKTKEIENSEVEAGNGRGFRQFIRFGDCLKKLVTKKLLVKAAETLRNKISELNVQ